MQSYNIGGDAVDIQSGETLKLTDGTTEYDVTAANGKWSAEVPNGVYSFKLTADYKIADFGDNNNMTFTFNFKVQPEQINTVKAFVWSDLNNIEPLSETGVIKK